MMPAIISRGCGVAGTPLLDGEILRRESLRLSEFLARLGETGGEGDSDLLSP